MAVCVIGVHVVIVVLPVFISSVVGRVDIDGVHLALVGVEQGLQGVEIFGVDDGVVRLVAAAFDTAGGDQARIDGVAEFGDDGEVVNGTRNNVVRGCV